jgi:hypothetical protein
MKRHVVVGAASLLLCGFTVTPEYVQQAREDVAFCVDFAKRDAPSFQASVRSIDQQTGQVNIDRLNGSPRAEFAFSTCLTAIHKWRLVERNLPKTVDPTPPDPPAPNRYAGSGPLAR